MRFSYGGIKLEPALGTRQNLNNCHAYAPVVHTTAKKIISRYRKKKNVFKMSKDENARAKILFFIVKYADLWGF